MEYYLVIRRNKKELLIFTIAWMNLKKYHTKRNKSGPKDFKLCSPIYMTSQKRRNYRGREQINGYQVPGPSTTPRLKGIFWGMELLHILNVVVTQLYTLAGTNQSVALNWVNFTVWDLLE